MRSFSNGNDEEENQRNRANSNDVSDEYDADENSLDYLPNELKFSTEFHNEEAAAIYSGPPDVNQ